MKIIVLPLSKITQCLNKPAPVSKAAKRLAKKDNAEARASAGAKYPRIAATLKACHVTLQEGKKVSK